MYSKLMFSLIIFLSTLYLIVRRPFRINLGLAAGIGALASLLSGTVSLEDAIQAFMEIWDAALTFLGIVMLSLTLDAMGFFKWAALKAVRFSGGDGVKLYFAISALATIVSVLFANDSAVLILTPIVLEVVSQLKMDGEARLAYLFAAGLVADTAAMPLITSNPVNIVSANFFNYDFIDHLILMGPVAIVTIIISILTVYLFFRNRIPKYYSLEVAEILNIDGSLISKRNLKLIFFLLISIDVGYVIASLNGIPVSIVICSGALFLLSLYFFSLKNSRFIKEEKKDILQILREVNWDILIFMMSVFLVVQGLKHAKIDEFFAYLFTFGLTLPSVLGILVPSLIVTVSASAMNNWPMTMLGLISIKKAKLYNNLSPRDYTGLIFSNIIGNNLGPHFFPLGSLAILMWMETIRRRGLTIRLRDYLKVGSVLSILEVTTASIILWVELNILNLNI
ncbi:MAG: ArsB/NhaD family transporter [Candidatus Bathyarchaeia archaeon]